MLLCRSFEGRAGGDISTQFQTISSGGNHLEQRGTRGKYVNPKKDNNKTAIPSRGAQEQIPLLNYQSSRAEGRVSSRERRARTGVSTQYTQPHSVSSHTTPYSLVFKPSNTVCRRRSDEGRASSYLSTQYQDISSRGNKSRAEGSDQGYTNQPNSCLIWYHWCLFSSRLVHGIAVGRVGNLNHARQQ